MKTCIDVVAVVFITLGVLYLIENRKQIQNSIIKPITNMVKGNN